MPTLHGVRSTTRFNIFDSEPLGVLQRGRAHAYLFGNHNLGIPEYTNLQVPGFLLSDEASSIEHWYARTDLEMSLLSDTARTVLHRIASHIIVTLSIGDRPQTGFTRALSELLAERPWEPPSVTAQRLTGDELAQYLARRAARREEGVKPVIVPVRGNVSVRIDAGAVAQREQEWAALTDGRIWIHLEGSTSRDVA